MYLLFLYVNPHRLQRRHAAQLVEALFRDVNSVFLHGLLPHRKVKRHRVHQRPITVEDQPLQFVLGHSVRISGARGTRSLVIISLVHYLTKANNTSERAALERPTMELKRS